MEYFAHWLSQSENVLDKEDLLWKETTIRISFFTAKLRPDMLQKSRHFTAELGAAFAPLQKIQLLP